jgi:hypothetical protein
MHGRAFSCANYETAASILAMLPATFDKNRTAAASEFVKPSAL